LKARVRNLEAEIESLKLSNRALDRENARSRILIRTYITNDELNDKTWNLVENLGNDLIDLPNNDSDICDSKISESPNIGKILGFKRKDIVDIGRQHHRMLSKLEVEINGVLSSIQKEENRQLLLTHDLFLLVSQHPDLFGPGVWDNGKYKSGETIIPETSNKGTQVDLKDRHGVVEELYNAITPEELAADIAALPNPPKLPPNISAQAIATNIKGVSYPYQFRKLMGIFPHVLRIPPIVWTCETIMSIYGYSLMVEAKANNGINAAIHRVSLHELTIFTIYFLSLL
jgi:hypothetical protein